MVTDPRSRPLDVRRIFFFSLFLSLNLDFFRLKKVKNAAAYAAERPLFFDSLLKLKIRGL